MRDRVLIPGIASVATLVVAGDAAGRGAWGQAAGFAAVAVVLGSAGRRFWTVS